jgi:hypothetical protein
MIDIFIVCQDIWFDFRQCNSRTKYRFFFKEDMKLLTKTMCILAKYEAGFVTKRKLCVVWEQNQRYERVTTSCFTPYTQRVLRKWPRRQRLCSCWLKQNGSNLTSEQLKAEVHQIAQSNFIPHSKVRKQLRTFLLERDSLDAQLIPLTSPYRRTNNWDTQTFRPIPKFELPF